jgi:hypothetical protein
MKTRNFKVETPDGEFCHLVFNDENFDRLTDNWKDRRNWDDFEDPDAILEYMRTYITEEIQAEKTDSMFREDRKSYLRDFFFYDDKRQIGPDSIDIVEIEVENLDTSKCDETDYEFYTELGINPDWYNSPFDKTPSDWHFCCYYAMDCREGRVYSKDWNFFYCEHCGRTISEQCMSNGWHTYYRLLNDCEMVCLDCIEKINLEVGITIEDITDEDGSLIKYIPSKAMFFNTDALEEWTCEYSDSSIRVCGEDSAVRVIETIKSYLDNNQMVIIDLDRMAIGGLEGYVSIYHKEK